MSCEINKLASIFQRTGLKKQDTLYYLYVKMRKLPTFVLIGLLFLSLSLSATDIFFFNKDCNLDLAGADNTCADERHNLLNILNASSYNITLFSDWNAPNLASDLASNDMLLIPDMEDAFTDCNVNDPNFINDLAKATIKSYVEQGGSLVLIGSSQNVNFLNSIFALNISSTTVIITGFSIKDASQSIGTPFHMCPDSIPNTNATFLLTSTIPEGKRCIYSYKDMSSVAIFSIGSGQIIYMGYDFNDAGPGCSNNGITWEGCILPSTISIGEFGPGGIPITIVPTVSEWRLIILGTLFFGAGLLFVGRLN